MEIDLDGMALFASIVDAGSLSAAGRALELPKATVSRRLNLIEKRLGVALLHRSTRSLTLTDPGRRYYERIRPIVAEARAAQREALSWGTTPSGLLRVSASEAFGMLVVAPALHGFAQAHPDVRIDLRLTDRRLNLIADGIDLAVRMGELDDSELGSRRLATVERALVAAPAYLERRGAPRDPRDLTAHATIATDPDVHAWTVGEHRVRVSWRFATGNMLASRDAARAGLGIAICPRFLVADDLASGALARVLPEFRLAPTRASALYPNAADRSSALRALIDHLVSHLSPLD